jgi:hypothetical protein
MVATGADIKEVKQHVREESTPSLRRAEKRVIQHGREEPLRHLVSFQMRNVRRSPGCSWVFNLFADCHTGLALDQAGLEVDARASGWRSAIGRLF